MCQQRIKGLLPDSVAQLQAFQLGHSCKELSYHCCRHLIVAARQLKLLQLLHPIQAAHDEVIQGVCV
jgi:hypothetical protein